MLLADSTYSSGQYIYRGKWYKTKGTTENIGQYQSLKGPGHQIDLTIVDMLG